MNQSSLNTKIAILKGGPSEEYDLSMKTGADLYAQLSWLGYSPIEITVSKKGEWLIGGIARDPQPILETLDLVFLGLHGAYGEDGTIQRILNRHAIPYGGSGAMSSALAFNKMLTKEHAKTSNIKLPKHLRVTRDSLNSLGRIANTINVLFGPQFIIKPVSSGSSIGISYAFSITGLVKELEAALGKYEEVLVEELINGIDVTCAYLDNFRDVRNYVFPPIQLVRSSEDKHLNVLTAEKVFPPQISKEAKQIIEDHTRFVHQALGCDQYSRSDYVVTPQGEVYFLEVNTLPSLSFDSPFLAAAEVVGAAPADVVRTILAGIKKNKR